MIHDYTSNDQATVDALLKLLGVQVSPTDGLIALPVQFGVGAKRVDSLDIETPSALEVIRAVAADTVVPDVHVADGLARPVRANASPLLTIHSSHERPEQSAVAVMHNGWWFFVDQRDHRSKQGFMILRTLIGLRLDKGASSQAAPVLTLPVAR